MLQVSKVCPASFRTVFPVRGTVVRLRDMKPMQNHDLKTRAYDIIRDKLIHCEYAPGSLLNEAQISDDLGVSRTPIREALNRISHEGFIRILPKKGILVTDVTLNDVMQIFQTRLEIEPVTLRMAGPHLRKEDLLLYRDKFKGPESDLNQGFKLDTAMHLYVIDHCGNRFLVDMMHKLFAENTRVVIATKQNEAKIHDARKEHLEILNLLLDENFGKAQEAMAVHLQSCRRAALDFFYNLPAFPARAPETPRPADHSPRRIVPRRRGIGRSAMKG